MNSPTGTGTSVKLLKNGGSTSGRAAIYAAIIIVGALPPAYMLYWLLSDTNAASSAPLTQKPVPVAGPVEAEAPLPALTPASPELISSALEAIWSNSEPEGISIGDERGNMRETLRASFPRPPTVVEILYAPAPNTAGFFTLRAKDESGHERMVAVRLLPRPQEARPWKVDRVVVIGAQPIANQKK